MNEITPWQFLSGLIFVIAVFLLSVRFIVRIISEEFWEAYFEEKSNYEKRKIKDGAAK